MCEFGPALWSHAAAATHCALENLYTDRVGYVQSVWWMLIWGYTVRVVIHGPCSVVLTEFELGFREFCSGGG
jgi:hypothetical protein